MNINTFPCSQWLLKFHFCSFKISQAAWHWPHMCMALGDSQRSGQEFMPPEVGAFPSTPSLSWVTLLDFQLRWWLCTLSSASVNQFDCTDCPLAKTIKKQESHRYTPTFTLLLINAIKRPSRIILQAFYLCVMNSFK